MSENKSVPGIPVEDNVAGKIRRVLGDKFTKFQKYWNPAPEEKDRLEMDLLASLEAKTGILRRETGPLNEEEFPEEYFDVRNTYKGDFTAITYPDYEKIVGNYEPTKGLSKRQKVALFSATLPVIAYGIGLPQLLRNGSFNTQIKPKLNPVNPEGHHFDLIAQTHGVCSVDVYSPDGKLLSSVKPDGSDAIKITNFSGDSLLGSDCAPGDKQKLNAHIDGPTYAMDMVAWSAYMAEVSRSWHRQATALDKAHEITTGSENVTVAIVEDQFNPNHFELSHVEAIGKDGTTYKDPTTLTLNNDKGETFVAARYNSSYIEHATATTGLIGADIS